MDKKTVGKNIRIIRITKGISLVDLAEAMGVSKGTVSSWETGRFSPGFAKLNKIAGFFSVPLEELISLTPEKPYVPKILSLGDVIRSARKILGYTQAQVAEELGVAQSTYAAWEKGAVNPSISQIKAMCLFFDISACEMIGLACYQGDSRLFHIIKDYDSLTNEGKEKVSQYIEDIKGSNSL